MSFITLCSLKSFFAVTGGLINVHLARLPDAIEVIHVRYCINNIQYSSVFLNRSCYNCLGKNHYISIKPKEMVKGILIPLEDPVNSQSMIILLRCELAMIVNMKFCRC